MVLFIVGSGLLEPNNLTIKGQISLKSSDKCYIYESSYQPYDKNNLEHSIKKSLISISSNDILKEIERILEESKMCNVSLLMPGDPFTDLLYSKIVITGKRLSATIKVIHNACLLNFISNSGLQLYRFAEFIYVDRNIHGTQILETAARNIKKDLHSLIVFDSTLNTFEQLVSILKTNELLADLKTTGIIIVSVTDSKLQISPLLQLYSDFTNFKCSTVCAVIIPGKCHEMEESVLKSISSGVNSSLKDRGIFHLIGLGLGQPEDVTIKGKEAIANSSKVFLEGYTSIMIGGKEALESYFNKEIIVADRDMVETDTHLIFEGLKEGNVAFLVVGDPLGATTHTDLIIRATSEASSIDIVHNASIINAVGISSLNPNKFGEVVSIPFWEETWKPDSFYDKLCNNFSRGLHTLCLLDIKVKEQSMENLLRGRKIYEKPRYMTVSQAAQQLVQIIDDRKQTDKQTQIEKTASVFCLARIGTNVEEIKLTTLEETVELDLGGPLHSLIVMGPLNEEEQIACNTFS